MLDVQPFAPADLQSLQLGAHARGEMERIGDWHAMLVAAAQAGPAWTGRWDGRVIGVAGIALRWAGRATTWCTFAEDIPKPAWLAIHRAVQARFDQMRALGVVRIEADVVRGFPPGDRWVRLLGFELEGVARQFGPAGQDFGRYARIAP